MTRIVVIGDRGSGKTTFLGLLYAAQVARGSAVRDDFRFHVGYDSLDEISEVFNQIMSGHFPDSAAKEGIREIDFQIVFEKSGSGILARLRTRRPSPSGAASLHLIVLRNLEQEMARYQKGGTLANVALRELLECDAATILVDSTNLLMAEDDRPLGPMGRYDAAVESLLAALQGSRLHGSRAWLHPIFVFSKFDAVDPKALRAADIEGRPPEPRKTGARAAYAEALLEFNLPRALARVRTREDRGMQFAKPSYFFSWLRTDPPKAGGRERIRLRASGPAAWEPDYSEDEYLALLAGLVKIAAGTGE